MQSITHNRLKVALMASPVENAVYTIMETAHWFVNNNYKDHASHAVLVYSSQKLILKAICHFGSLILRAS